MSNKELKIADGYRTNRLSLQPGGHEVRIHYLDGRIFTYDKVKNPRSYVGRFNLGEIFEIYVDGKLYWKA